MGKPGPGNTGSSSRMLSGGGETQGSETSQYLEEKKPKGIPPVAASEKGTA